jgi:glycosyltransferase involved in cell wall biosynthesis
MVKTSLSVICPSYNRASFLPGCVEPLIDLELMDVEFIIVDDASGDNTQEVVLDLQRRYGSDRIISIRLEKNSGAQVARNRGMEAAKGSFFLFVDSDDVPVAKGVLELAGCLGRDPLLAYAYGRVEMTDGNLRPLQGMAPIGSAFADTPAEIAGYHWHTMGALYRRDYLERVGPWNIDLTGSQDWEYQARVKLIGGRGLFVDTLVGYWRQHDGGRVGTKKFRPDYVRSVVTACNAILEGAVQRGHADVSLCRRLAKKLILHALECGAAGDAGLRSLCFAQTRKALRGDRALEGACVLISLLPSWFDGSLWSLLTGRNIKR